MKYSFDLKESLPRKLLRYALWAIILLGLVALVVNGGHLVKHSILSANMGDPSGALAVLSPEKTLSLAEKLYQFSPSEKTKLRWIRVAVNTESWRLADILLDDLRPAKIFGAQVLNALVVAQTAPEALPAALAEIKTVPQDDDERLMLLQLACVAGDDNISNLARRNARSIQDKNVRNRAQIYLAQMAMNEGRPQESRELATKLIGQKLPAADAVNLLQTCETLQISEAGDYRSSLKLAAHSDAPLAICLARYFAKNETPEKVWKWLESLPEEISTTPEVYVKIVELKEKMTPGSAPSADAQEIYTKSINAKDLSLASHLAHETGDYKEELQLLKKLNQTTPTLWSQVASIEAAKKSQNTEALLSCYSELNKNLPENTLIKSQMAYLDLLTQKQAKESYDLLKSAQTRYPDRNEIKIYLAFADDQLGNLTDAVVLLPKDPATQRQKLLCAKILAQAGQNDRAEALLKDLSPEELLPEENDLYQKTLKKLQESAPLREWINILKKN